MQAKVATKNGPSREAY